MNIEEFDFSVDLLQTLLWQYNKATSLQSLLTQKQAWYDLNQSEFWENWITNVFDIRTANQFGLAVWAIILAIPLYINTQPPEPGAPIFGFNEDPSINDYLNFETSNFSNIGSSEILTVEEQRLILRLRYFQLVTRGNIAYVEVPSEDDSGNQLMGINNFLDYLWKTSTSWGQVWALDDFDMTMTYVFNFFVSRVMRKVLVELDLLPRPATVGIKYIVLTDSIWGFNEIPSINSYQNFYPGDGLTTFGSNFIPEYF